MEPMTISKLLHPPHSHIREKSIEGLLGRHALCMLGRTLDHGIHIVIGRCIVMASNSRIMCPQDT